MRLQSASESLLYVDDDDDGDDDAFESQKEVGAGAFQVPSASSKSNTGSSRTHQVLDYSVLRTKCTALNLTLMPCVWLHTSTLNALHAWKAELEGLARRSRGAKKKKKEKNREFQWSCLGIDSHTRNCYHTLRTTTY